MQRKLTLAHLTALDLPPPALIRAAAVAGFDAVGLRLVQVTPDSPGYPLSDAGALAATRAAIAATGVTVSDVEFIKITPDFAQDDFLAMLDTGAELGAKHVITAPYDEDLSRLADRLGRFAEAADQRSLGTVLEFFPWTPVPDLETCWQVVQQAGPLPGILLDALHFDRSGSGYATLAQIPASRLPFGHLCDAMRHAPYSTDDLLRTARQERLAPGEGQIPLLPLLRALPPGLPLGLEVPGPARPGEDAQARLTRIRKAATRLCAQAEAEAGHPG